eukprot:UN10565
MMNQSVMMTATVAAGSGTAGTAGPAQSKISNDRSNGGASSPTHGSTTGPSQYPPKSMGETRRRSRSKDKSNIPISPSHSSSQHNPPLTMQIPPPLSLNGTTSSSPLTSPTTSNNNNNNNNNTNPNVTSSSSPTTSTTPISPLPPPVRTMLTHHQLINYPLRSE